MRVAIIGTGDVGWALAAKLAGNKNIKEVLVVGRAVERVNALIMDICSAYPEAYDKVLAATPDQLGESDIVILTSGERMKPGQSANDVWSSNALITKEILSASRLKSSAVLITLATPVDDITILAQFLTGLPTNQVFGFGGDLDRNRLEYTLRVRKIAYSQIELVGEQGGNAIPVYRGEESYEDVARDVRGFLKKVTAQAGETRNLSTAILIASLVDSIITNSGRTHYLCGYHKEHGIYLTWGFTVGAQGISEPNKIELYDRARIDLAALVERRRGIDGGIRRENRGYFRAV